MLWKVWSKFWTSLPLSYCTVISINVMVTMKGGTTWKVFKYGVFSGPYFPNMVRYSISLRIQSECGKNRPEKTLYLDTFQAERGWIIIQVTSNRIANMTKFLHLCLLYTKKSQNDIRAAIREVQMMKKLSLHA